MAKVTITDSPMGPIVEVEVENAFIVDEESVKKLAVSAAATYIEAWGKLDTYIESERKKTTSQQQSRNKEN